jgi:hypothetical protein
MKWRNGEVRRDIYERGIEMDQRSRDEIFL